MTKIIKPKNPLQDDLPAVRTKEHYVPAQLNFNDVLDQLYLAPSSGLMAVFSNVKINGTPQEIDVTRRLKEKALEKWPYERRQNIYHLLVNFGIQEFYRIVDIIKSDGVGEFDCYKVEKELKGITLPIHSHIYLMEEEKTLAQRFSFGRKHVNTALLVFKKTAIFEKEVSQVSTIVKGKTYSNEVVDREEITTYEDIDLPETFVTQKRIVDAMKDSQEKKSTTKETNEAKNDKESAIVLALLNGEKKIAYLSSAEHKDAILALEKKASRRNISRNEESLLKMLDAYKK
ncbi:MAG: hypothetical protein ACI86H_000957 [bacterium]|jgi:hypothetical protein